MRPATHSWQAELPHIEKFLLDGLSVAAVARYYGVTPQHLNRLLRTLDSPMRSTRRPRAPRIAPTVPSTQHEKAQLRLQLEANKVKAAQNILYVEAKREAEMRELSWGLSEADIQWPTRCPIRGIPLVYRLEGYTHNHKHTRPVLSLINPHKGYVPGNVRVISAMAARNIKDLKT